MHPCRQTLQNISRRHLLAGCGLGVGQMALAKLLADPKRTTDARSHTPGLAPKSPHFPAKAKAVIHLLMAGAPSQLDLFDPKPQLSKLEGKPLPKSIIGDQRYAFIQPDAAVLGPRFPFRQHGESGAVLGSPLHHLGKVADRLCVVKSMYTDQFNHAPAQLLMNTGFSQPGRPSLGSWALYGLGAETRDLPAFVVMSTGSGVSGGNALWSSGFMPTLYTGTRFRNGRDPILNVGTPKGFGEELQADTFSLIDDLNKARQRVLGDPEIDTRIASFEMAARLQLSAPELMDLQRRPGHPGRLRVRPRQAVLRAGLPAGEAHGGARGPLHQHHP